MQIADDLRSDDANRVKAYLLGHALNVIAPNDTKGIPIDGIEDELRRNYSTLATGEERTTNLIGPERFGYNGDDIARELMAEAFRAYMTNPNYMKTVAPNTAKRIRAYVNPNERINRTIQFN